MAKRRTVGLIAFLKGTSNPADRMPGCANYDDHYGGCLFADTCCVQEGQRCAYFEQVVLPTAADIGLKEMVYRLYARHVGIELDSGFIASDIRHCPDCGLGLRGRQKYCDDCSKRRRLGSYRENRKKKRLMRNT